MYEIDQQNQKLGKNNERDHYHICFMWIAMSIISPYIIYYSSMMNNFYLKGYFIESNLNLMTCRRKLEALFTMTFLGLVLMTPLLDIFLKVEALIWLLTLPLFCKYNNVAIAKKIHIGTEYVIKEIFGLNFFELYSFEQ